MPTNDSLSGVYAAAVTPLKIDLSLDLDSVPTLFDYFYQHGCHGALLFGTTGEGPSFSPKERQTYFNEAARAQTSLPGFHLLVGTGTPSLDETISLTKIAFDSGMDGTVVLPPYYYRDVSDDGLYAWFKEVIQRGVPEGGAFFGYHIPKITGISFSLDLLARLKDTFPTTFRGIKDSSGDKTYAQQVGQRFGSDMVIFTGNDRLFNLALENHASGCITALANLFSRDLRQIWDAALQGKTCDQAQDRMNSARSVSEHYQPATPFIKAVLNRRHGFPSWTVRPPLLPLSEDTIEKVLVELPPTG
jgi:4-hydroxy-tetrahydrodipicolinate synthase